MKRKKALFNTLERYFARQIYGAVGFVLLGFLLLFAFFNLVHELADLGNGNYHLREIFLYVVLSSPANAYDLFPIVVLIGTLYVLAHLASNSEFTVMRGSGLSPRGAWRTLFKIGVVFMAVTFVTGEWIAPYSEEAAQKVRQRAMSSLIGEDLSSGLWFKDARAFINVREARQAHHLEGLKIFEFDSSYRLSSITRVREAEYRGKSVWHLLDVAVTRFTVDGPRLTHMAETDWHSAVTPDMLDALIVKPDKMSVWALHKYIQHLTLNKQKTERYEIAMWKKVLYPIATLVMMALALPFAYMHARAGMVGVKVFLGIMLGIFFYMLNGLFAHVGLLQNWPPIAAAAVPSLMFFLTALTMMWWVERR
jgi:lipopolysaccharide export system permease protein